MMTGSVRAGGQAFVTLRVAGPAGCATVEALIDTGFAGSLALPSRLIDELALRQIDVGVAVLADERAVEVCLHECVVAWGGDEIVAIVVLLEGGPLVGMALLRDHVLTMRVVEGGEATIVPLG